MNKNLPILAIVLVVLLAGGLLAYNAYQSNKITQPTIQTKTTSPGNSPSTGNTIEKDEDNSSTAQETNDDMAGANAVTISSSGFSPQTITIKVGESVTWSNSDTASHTVNSDNHPTHLLYPFLNKVGPVKPGEKKSVAFDSAGTFTYHDHLNAALVGKVIVK